MSWGKEVFSKRDVKRIISLFEDFSRRMKGTKSSMQSILWRSKNNEQTNKKGLAIGLRMLLAMEMLTGLR